MSLVLGRPRGLDFGLVFIDGEVRGFYLNEIDFLAFKYVIPTVYI
ncbi:MAG: hypothetical protein OXC61_09070 [Flavobacteriaceae bacterium]|nr:hypothetical protein [Flavobacteriaceae bacterium]